MTLTNQITLNEFRISTIVDSNLSQHLRNNNLNVLICNTYPLASIHLLNFAYNIFIKFFLSTNSQNILTCNYTICNCLSRMHKFSLMHQNLLRLINQVFHHSSIISSYNNPFFAPYWLTKAYNTINLC